MRKRTIAAIVIGGFVAAKVLQGAQAKLEQALQSKQANALGDRFANDDWGNDVFAAISYDPAESAAFIDTRFGADGMEGMGQAPHYTHTKMPGAAADGSWMQDLYAADRLNDDDNAVDPLAFADGDPAGLGLAPQMHNDLFPGQSRPGSWMTDLYAADAMQYDPNAVDAYANDPEDPAGLGRRRFRMRNPVSDVRRSMRATFRPLAETLRKVAARPVSMIRRDVRAVARGAGSALRKPFSQLKRFQKNDPFSFMMGSRKLLHHGGGGTDAGGGGGGPIQYQDANGQPITEAQYNALQAASGQSTMSTTGVTTDANGVVTANNQGFAPPGVDNPDDAPQTGEFYTPLQSEADPDATTPDGQIPEIEAQYDINAPPSDHYANDPLDAVQPNPDDVTDMVQSTAQRSTTYDYALQADDSEPQPSAIDTFDARPDTGSPTGGRIVVNDLDWMAARSDQQDPNGEPVGFDENAPPLSGLGDLCDAQGCPIVAMRPRDGWRGRSSVPISGMDLRRMQADACGNVYLWNSAQLVKVGTVKHYGGPNRTRRLIRRAWNRSSTPGLFDVGSVGEATSQFTDPRSEQDSVDDGSMGCGQDSMNGLGFSFKSLTWGSKAHDRITRVMSKVDPSFAAYKYVKSRQPLWSRYRRIWGYSAPYVMIAGAAVATVYTGGAAAPALAAAVASAGTTAYATETNNRRRDQAMRDQERLDMMQGSPDSAESAAIRDSARLVDDPAGTSHLQAGSGAAPGELPGGDSSNEYAGDGVNTDFLDILDIT